MFVNQEEGLEILKKTCNGLLSKKCMGLTEMSNRQYYLVV